MTNQLLIYGGIAILAIIIIISLIKKAIKLVLFIGAVILLISLYNIFVNGVSPLDELNAYKTNIQYAKDIKDYTEKVSSSVNNIRNIIENKKLDASAVKTINDEDSKLHQYQNEVKLLKHTKKLDFFHNKYSEYLSTIVSTTDGTVKITETGGKTINDTENLAEKLKLNMDNLTKLELK
jgi:hypothetical protein